MASRTIILASGGTGGHIFPAEALAEVLRARGYEPHLITDHRFHQYNKASGEGILGSLPIHTIRAGNLSGGFVSKLKQAVFITQGLFQAARLIRRLQPVAVVGFGGYPSFPTMLASILLRRTTILHEQNSVLGRVNRALAGYVHRIAASYPDMQHVPQGVVSKIVVTGNPVRSAVQALARLDYPGLETEGMLRLLVLGGSQGASVFSEILPEAMARLPDSLRARIRLDQQCRAQELDATRARYAELNMQVDLSPFFNDVAARLAAAHLVISRAGASTVAELMVAGRPALLVPLPSATDNHQYFNARAIEDTGAGWVMTQNAFTPESVASRLETVLRAPQRLAECAGVMRRLGKADAADTLADAVLAATGRTNGKPILTPPLERAA